MVGARFDKENIFIHLSFRFIYHLWTHERFPRQPSFNRWGALRNISWDGLPITKIFWLHPEPENSLLCPKAGAVRKFGGECIFFGEIFNVYSKLAFWHRKWNLQKKEVFLYTLSTFSLISKHSNAHNLAFKIVTLALLNFNLKDSVSALIFILSGFLSSF